MSEFLEQDISYSINKRSDINLEKCLNSISMNDSETQSINNPSDGNQQIILKIINNSKVSEQNENINYKNLYEELQIKNNAILEENKNLKNENQKLKFQIIELKREINNYKKNENEIENENNDLSFNNEKNFELSLTHKNSSSSIDLSTHLNDQEVNELKEPKINRFLTEKRKSDKYLKIKEKYYFTHNNKLIKSISTKKTEDQNNQFCKNKPNIDKIKNFREKYKLLDINKYPDDTIIKALKENNYDEEETYKFLTK